MPRQVRDAKIETRAARARLVSSRKPHWRGLEDGVHIGYRKPRSGSGRWVRRVRVGEKYLEEAFATADDFDDADGDVVLSYAQAQSKIRAERIERERAALGLQEPRRGPYTVAKMLEDYEADYLRRGKKAITTVRSISSAHILPAIGDIEVARLTTDRLRRWHAGLADAHAMLRTARGAERSRREHTSDDADAVRRRRSTANRILTVLKAALNFAYAEGHVASDDAWRRAKPFRDVEAARIRSLTAIEASALADAADPVIRPLIRAALLTGARYGELCRLKVADISLRNGTIFIAESKSGKPRHVPLTDEGMVLFEKVSSERAQSEHVFVRDSFLRQGNGRGNKQVTRPWKPAEANRFMQQASERAGFAVPVRFHELRHTYASLLVSAGVSLAFVAEVLGHADTRITSKHYAHVAPSSVANAIRGALPRFTAEGP